MIIHRRSKNKILKTKHSIRKIYKISKNKILKNKTSYNKKRLQKKISNKKYNITGGLNQIQDEKTGKINMIIAFGYIYQTLNYHEVNSDVIVNTPRVFQPLPDLFEVAIGNDCDLYICSKFNWQSKSLVFLDGTRCTTALNQHAIIEKTGKNLININTIDLGYEMYSTKYETMDILLRKKLKIYNEIDEINMNGHIYKGHWNCGMRNGKGEETLPSGETYEGDWYNNKRQGRGKQILPDGETYEGDWDFDFRQGRGKQILPDGETYEGDWYFNKRQGKGKQTLPSGETYEGDWDFDFRQGRGKQILPDGETYEGDWYYNIRHGKGKQTLSSGETYEGDWNMDFRQGRGKQTLSSDETYEGDWIHNNRQGRGKQTLPSGETYEGDWDIDIRHGKGKQTLPSGETYEGDWHMDNRQGNGKQTLPSGETYEGDWIYNNRQGRGKQTLPSGESYQGNWYDGEKRGNIIKTYINGERKPFFYFPDNTFISIDINDYIIHNQFKLAENKYITILINLHGSDIMNSNCILNDTKHVRLITPAICGNSNFVSGISKIIHFNIAYNTTHIKLNNNASTYQKNDKIIELLNEYYTDYYDKQYDVNKRPLIDHQYSIEYNNFCRIYLIDTNYNPHEDKSYSSLFFPRIDEFTDIDFEQQRPKILTELTSNDIIKEVIEGLDLNDELKEKLQMIPYPPDGNKLARLNIHEIRRWMDRYIEPPIQDIICDYMLGMKSRNTLFSEQKFNLVKHRNTFLHELSLGYSLNQYDIMSEILNHLPNREENINVFTFLRSTLINLLLDMGYDTINMFDLSCRIKDEIIINDDSNITKGKNYQCIYEQSEEGITHISDTILSTGM